jgi:hypothetical protein
MNVRLTVAASLSFLLLTGAASAAQPWLEDRRYGEGIGIREGRFEFHPGISAEFGYDSNFFQRAPLNRNNRPADVLDPPVADAWRLRVTPSVTIETVTEGHSERGAQNPGAAPLVELQANAFASYSELFGSEEVSKERNFDLGVGGKLTIARQRPFGADIYGDFVRNGEPSNLPGTDHTFDRGQVRGGAGVSWRPGGGLFDWRLGYEAAYSYFEDQPYRADQNLQQSILTNGRWRILPRSGFLYDARYTFVRYTHANATLQNGDVLQARVGFSGLITSRFALLGMIGWNSTFYDHDLNKPTVGQNYDGIIGQAELKYFVMPGPEGDSAQTGLSSIAVGYLRDTSNSYVGSFYTRDRGYLSFDWFLGGVFVANIQGGLSNYSFPASTKATDTSPGNVAFTQQHVDASVFGEYRFSDTFALNGQFLFDRAFGKGPNQDGLFVGTNAAGQNVYDDLEYVRYQAYIGLRLFW